MMDDRELAITGWERALVWWADRNSCEYGTTWRSAWDEGLGHMELPDWLRDRVIERLEASWQPTP